MRARGDAARLLVGELRAAIRDGRLRPGQRIGQAAIAGAFGVSRLPVREALRELQSEGLVTLVPNAGARVASLDAEELEEVYWLRERLEPPLLAESLPSLTAETVVQLRRFVDEMEALTGERNAEGWEKTDRQFHILALTAAPRRGRVHRMVENLWDLSAPYRLAYIRQASADALAAVGMEHRLLLEAIELGRVTEAELLLRGHISRVRTGLQSQLELFDEPASATSADSAPPAQREKEVSARQRDAPTRQCVTVERELTIIASRRGKE